MAITHCQATSGDGSNQDAAHRVFRIPELLEKILDNRRLHIRDLFHAAAVCRTWKATFEGSTILQKKAQLIADFDTAYGGYEHSYDDELGILINCQTTHCDDVSRRHWELFFAMSEHVPIQTTLNLKRCFATQPPCTKMVATPKCCEDDKEIIRGESGLTIGDVVSTATRMFKEHEHCPEMIREMSEAVCEWKNQAMYPSFRGVITLADDNPIRVAELQKQALRTEKHKEKVAQLEGEGWGDAWYEYRKARRTAAAQGEDLPRWPAFIAKNPKLAPKNYLLSQFEAAAADRPR
ncbi:hypothetical protein LTR37_002676 [Vermiconidia calcicola]|uniref:Uncharacterized protein n=1 Tax=Vermiconidia calcicola TaxID=1690605 RepID=A0ACC3NSX8_9PEZI|nr:hypothetical protein LTR37_002676 [Vermiconidia calcicola]